MVLLKPTKRDREAAKKVLARCAAEFGYSGNRPYSEMIKYLAEAISQARSEGASSILQGEK